jgi:DNA-binding response OmpR family regulator
MKELILVVEDDDSIAHSIEKRLLAEDYLVDIAQTGLEAVDKVFQLHPDLILLDIMLPGIDGLEVARRVQTKFTIPILMLTAKDDEVDMLIGFGVGADDYMTKPFSMRELIARIKALLRRSETTHSQRETIMKFGDLVVDKKQLKVFRNDVEIHLTPTEFQLLLELSSNPKTVLSREDLLKKVWNWQDANSDTRTVDSHIKGLRQKIGSELIRTVHGIGFSFEAESTN